MISEIDSHSRRDEAAAPPLPARKLEILKPGRNCWRVATASRAAVLVDGEALYGRLDQSLRSAQRSILLIGWDFDAIIRLRPQDGEESERVGPLLRSLVEERPDLEIRILVWNLSLLHAPSATLPHLLGEKWQDHPRISVKLDAHHPALAAQHQKVIVIDSQVAFVGGFDLTVDRWDTSLHPAEDERRRKPDGTPYGPVHDIQMVVEGKVARALAELAAIEWRRAGGVDIAPGVAPSDAWPAGLVPDFTNVPVAIARTRPRWRGGREIREAADLTGDAIRAARKSIYIEAQYFTDFRLGQLIAARLSEPDGPEVVVVVTRQMHGVIEGLFMNSNRSRLVRKLSRADRYDRFRVWHPLVPDGDQECGILIHAKLVIVDEKFLRVGSSNLNNRSTGFDLECDLAVEATNSACAGIEAVRARLIGEHIGETPEAVAATIAAEGSLIRAIETLNGNERRLAPFTLKEKGPIRPVLGTRLIDPARSSRWLSPFRKFWRRLHSPRGAGFRSP